MAGDEMLYFARAGDLEGVRRMIEADPTQANYQRIVTPLMWTSYCGHVDVARYLLDHGAFIDQTEEGKGRTALYLASGRGHAEVVKLLLRRGANPTIKRKGGWCPLSVAASEAHVTVVRILLKHHKVDVDSRDNDGSTALYRAALWGCAEAVRELLRKGADPTIPGGGGLKPLAVARARGYTACIEALEDAERVYELAKVRKLRRVRTLLEKVCFDPEGGILWSQGIPSYLRNRLEGVLDLSLPLVTLYDTEACHAAHVEDEMDVVEEETAEKVMATTRGGGGSSSRTVGAIAGGGPGSTGPATAASSLWTAWIRGANQAAAAAAAAAVAAAGQPVQAPAAAGGGRGGGGGEDGGPAAPLQIAASTSTSSAASSISSSSSFSSEGSEDGERGGCKADLAAAITAMVVKDVSYDVFLSLTEMLI